MEEMMDRINSVPLAPEATGISYAGERSQAGLARREQSGIPLAGWTCDQLNRLAAVAGLPPLVA